MLDATEMLEVTKVSEGTKLIVTTSGRVDTDTAEFFDEQVSEIPEIVDELVVDMENLEYVSSSGLRILLTLTKQMRDRGGSCVFINVPDIIKEIFEMCGLLNVFTIE